jgi:hypothetical protein
MNPLLGYEIDAEIADILAVVTDALFSSDACDVNAAFDYVMERDNVAPIITTLSAAEARLLALYTARYPDLATCDVSDALAETVMTTLWNSPGRILMAQASLRTCLDNGSYDGLSPEMHKVYAKDQTGERINVLLMLVTGISALYAREHALPAGGDTLRQALIAC